jgi:hypothetical protein
MPRYMPRIQYIFLPHATCRSIVLQPPLLSFTSGDPEKMNWWSFFNRTERGVQKLGSRSFHY